MIRLAIPNKGRLSDPTLKFLAEAGLKVKDAGERMLFANTENKNVSILFVRAQDIPRYVELGAADLGITGQDLIEETSASVEQLVELDFGYSRVAVAAPDKNGISNVKQLRGKTIATHLPGITKKFFKSRNIPVKILQVAGATEVAPFLGLAEAIVDQVSTGTTLAVHRLKIIETILESKVCLIANKNSMKKNSKIIEGIILACKGTIDAREMKYLMMNVKDKKALDRVIRIAPAMESPTILELAKGGYAVHLVINERELANAIRELKQAGAKDLLVLNIERVVA